MLKLSKYTIEQFRLEHTQVVQISRFDEDTGNRVIGIKIEGSDSDDKSTYDFGTEICTLLNLTLETHKPLNQGYKNLNQRYKDMCSVLILN